VRTRQPVADRSGALPGGDGSVGLRTITLGHCYVHVLNCGEGEREQPLFETEISGTWLLATVATQSISVLGTLLADHFRSYREPVLFFTLCMFLLGCMLYLILITLIFYRFTFVNLTTVTLTPPYWINMGAVAITTLAGARLIIAAPTWSLLDAILPFIKRIYSVLLGDRYMVDSIVVHPWYLATSAQAFSAGL
jgi:tellurite resistance protein TehA-like permease